MLKGGLIGCGFFAHNHLHAWQEIDGVTITALCDRDEARLKQAGEKFGVSRLYTDAAQMIAREISRLRRYRNDCQNTQAPGRIGRQCRPSSHMPETLRRKPRSMPGPWSMHARVPV